MDEKTIGLPKSIQATRLVFQFRDTSIMGEDRIWRRETKDFNFDKDRQKFIKCWSSPFTMLHTILIMLKTYAASADHLWKRRGVSPLFQSCRITTTARSAIKDLQIAYSEQLLLWHIYSLISTFSQISAFRSSDAGSQNMRTKGLCL